MTDAVVGVVVGAILAGAVSYFVSSVLRKRDQEDRQRRREAVLRSALVFILKELKAAKENPTIRNGNKVKYPPPILASGLDLLKTKSLFDAISNEAQNSLLTAYDHFHRINHYIIPLEGLFKWSAGGEGQMEIDRLRPACQDAIHECMSKIEDELRKMQPADR